MPPESDCPYVGRGGLKLKHALDEFGIDPTGYICADLGCSTGGFVDCLLQAGAAKVVAVDTAYGQLAWRLRSDERVEVLERSNALHVEPTVEADLVSIDLGWTKQEHAIPAALKWIKPSGSIVTLIKPHYELGRDERDAMLVDGVLPEDVAERVVRDVVEKMTAMGVEVVGLTKSPVLGGAVGKKRKKSGKGNAEWLAHVRRA